MTTLHLIFESLERVFNNGKDMLYIIKRKKQIKNILSDCCTLPSVIDNIIYKYTDELIELSIDITISDFPHQFVIVFKFAHNDFNGTLQISYNNRENFYFLYINDIHPTITQIIDNRLCSRYINKFNIFMKRYYMLDNYINCNTIEHEYEHLIYKHNIMPINTYTHTTLKIIDYRKLTYLIVTIKCLIDGVKKYFKIHNMYNYCHKKLYYIKPS